ncbi:MAG: Histidine triad (HIT) protein [Candidatus Falkowbacteria bacterium GW2011_GWC2_38_22]|uniref:Histidine triad (HIT) protein n=1 Tax=Candidatus Falkowbacteria bacterium GW2011_GWE1_38_31 TaxID=1618638 RepID=A0A0G0N1J3_9BACT|nr:MAG: Histidine triad (HIT) protein [Candidatus Falkowbacteria bacterium GW2011_GWF2_38_1205]KKQ62171.1 MAG: Histidine triad (HIT) protein [Candidatus Falkowbacteria bacterium GW2011_GWC2_38_22]KKQ64321.1 MAG: Histidine triad (HIT) protein [Candidatus Falkowbacteria bacterium GW2011_GWF1_38_22]KKQ66298.1 MAG: Histidine triad (HIT) protein [Candidatus Falkowbacteria bacterium GW2011_GWE2_38_254]KKQ71026.1 MAG: Histidine triad (HIT) protein [Candidatus Falkowbacteria bacterium GW2011_GWE1_38_31
MDCIFCKIIASDIPSYKVYEDDMVYAFFDILPISQGHTIIVSKKHVADIEGLSEEELSAMTKAVKKIGKAMIEGLGVKGYSVFLDNKSAANQHVPHVHFHLVPRAEGDGLERWPQSGYGEGEAEFCLKKVQSKL